MAVRTDLILKNSIHSVTTLAGTPIKTTAMYIAGNIFTLSELVRYSMVILFTFNDEMLDISIGHFSFLGLGFVGSSRVEIGIGSYMPCGVP